MAPRFPGRGRPNVGARIAHLATRRRTDGTRRTTARGDEHFWLVFLHTVQSFLGANLRRVGSIGTPLPVITDNLEKELAKHPASLLDSYLPWLYGQVDVGYAEKYARAESDKKQGPCFGGWWSERYDLDPETWRELRHWILLTSPDLSNVDLQSAVYDAIDWAENLAEVGGGGPLAENLHERLPEVVVDIPSKGAAWRTGGATEVWMAIGRELGHCYRDAGILADYLDDDGDGVLYVLVGKDGKPRVTVSIKDCHVEIKGARNQLPMPRFHEAVTRLFSSTRHTWDLLAECDPDEETRGVPSASDMRAMDIAVATEALRFPYLDDPYAIRDLVGRWKEAGKKLADVKGAFPPAFWTYLAAVQTISRWAALAEQHGRFSSAREINGVRLVFAPSDFYDGVFGESATFLIDTRSYAAFAKSVAKIPKDV